MDIGKSSYKIMTVTRSFEVAFKILLAHVTEPRIESVSILSSILPTTPEMMKRQPKQEPGAERRSTQDVTSGNLPTSSDSSRRKRPRLEEE
eukprot:CAMPEP_0116574848 /NCGR_PEP_ID=MMETSP0397-20121206/19627_1 /TAXON_ID=216820 /ORGANISM="Cyclophora tenuis, Strain ECT3854" /LENGTH=90 /DNA_ID=CAMNT_0004103669 /DNA_START=193 /DNA_END=465 /DNA_ORIENTATION=+